MIDKHVTLQFLWICVTIIKKRTRNCIFYHFGIRSWNDKKKICWPRFLFGRLKQFRSLEVGCVFLVKYVSFLFLFVLKEFNLFVHRVSNCVSFFVRKKHRQWRRIEVLCSKGCIRHSFLDLELNQWSLGNSFVHGRTTYRVQHIEQTRK